MKKANNKSPNMKVLVLITAAVTLLAAIFVLFIYNKSENQKLANHPNIDNQPTIGDENASVSLVEFGDYKCPSCKAWNEIVYPKLKADFIDTGKLKFTYINVLFHGEESALGAAAGEAVYKQDSDAYWTFHKQLFEEQPKELHDDLWITPKKVTEVSKKYVPEINQDEFKSDISSKEVTQEIEKDASLVKEFKVEKTPSIIINGTMLEDPFDYEEISRIINDQLEAEEE